MADEPEREQLRARLNFPSAPESPFVRRQRTDEPLPGRASRRIKPVPDDSGIADEVLAQLATLNATVRELADRTEAPPWVDDLAARLARLAEDVPYQLTDFRTRMETALAERDVVTEWIGNLAARVDLLANTVRDEVAEVRMRVEALAYRYDEHLAAADALPAMPAVAGEMTGEAGFAHSFQKLAARIEALATASDLREQYILSRLTSIQRSLNSSPDDAPE